MCGKDVFRGQRTTKLAVAEPPILPVIAMISEQTRSGVDTVLTLAVNIRLSVASFVAEQDVSTCSMKWIYRRHTIIYCSSGSKLQPPCTRASFVPPCVRGEAGEYIKVRVYFWLLGSNEVLKVVISDPLFCIEQSLNY
uniref:Uncharacterized protein n=1 Tax=Ascaris lumbricoides TaxID=6252 RepID=A0A0M3I131_ASCLU